MTGGGKYICESSVSPQSAYPKGCSRKSAGRWWVFEEREGSAIASLFKMKEVTLLQGAHAAARLVEECELFRCAKKRGGRREELR